MNLTDKFIDAIFEFSSRDMEEGDVLQIKDCIVDYLAVTNAGAKILAAETKKALENENDAYGEFPVIALQRKASLYNALLVNSLNAHAAELDDGVRYANLHPGVSVLSALLTLANSMNLTANSILKGILVGYEASIRIAASIQPSHRNMGYHATGTCGAFGVALGFCAAAKLDKSQFKTALTVAASGSSGMLNIIKDQSELKPFNNALAVFAGFHAFNMAKIGFKPSEDVLNGKWGYFGMKTNELNVSKLYGIANRALIHDVYRKYYAACRHCHPAIEAAILCKNENNIDCNSIESITVETYSLAVDGHDNKVIKNAASAKMSTPYSVAVALIKGSAGISEFEETTIAEVEIQELLQKVNVIHNPEMTKRVPAERPAKITIEVGDKVFFTEQVNLAKGEPENPFSKTELRDKFFSLTSYNGMDQHQAKKLINKIYNFEENTKEIVALI